MVVEQLGRFRQPRVAGVFFREDDFVRRQPPVDRQRGVVPCDGALRFGSVVGVAFVLEERFVAQHGESVGESARNEQLAVVFARQFHGHVPAESRRAAADVHRHVEHAARDYAHEFRLRMGRQLEVEPAHHPVARARLVVLYEFRRPYQPVERPLRVALHEVAPGIAVACGFEDHHPFDGCLDNFHRCGSSSSFSKYRPYWLRRIGSASARSRSRVIQPWL